MERMFEELDYSLTPMGRLSLRRRRMLALDRDVLEVKLGDEFLMSSLFTEGERALARLGLAEAAGEALSVVVGGLGLGYTAAQALDDPKVGSLKVIDALEPVIDWHRRGLVPLGARLTADERCVLEHRDFFAYAEGHGGDEPVDVILLDIDHSPRALLHQPHGRFYGPEGQAAVKARLKPGGVFAMWSDEPPDADYMAVLEAVFPGARAQVVPFDNPLTGEESRCTIYLARRTGA